MRRTERDEDDETVADTDDEDAAPPEPETSRPSGMAPAENATFGAVPRDASMWSLHRRNMLGKFEPCTHATGNGLAAREFPLSMLSVATVRDWWGPGEYRVQWCRVSDKGGLMRVGHGRTFTVLDAPAAPAEPAPSTTTMDPYAMYRFVEQASNEKISAMAQLANVMRGGGSDGGTEARMQLLLQQQTNAFTEAMRGMTSALERLGQRVDRVEGSGSGPLERVPHVVGEVVREAAPTVVRAAREPRTFLEGFQTWAMKNPQEAFRMAQPLMVKLVEMMGPAAAGAQQHATAGPARPVVVSRAQPQPEPEAPAPPAPPMPGINAAFQSQPPPPAPPAPNGAVGVG